jgi:hypothetical protein
VKDKKTAVVYDLDSTVCDTRHRAHLAPGGGDPEATWLGYSSACDGDGLIPGIAERMLLDWQHHRVIILSCRPACREDMTRRWLDANIGPFYDDVILMPEELLGGTPDDMAGFKAGQVRGIIAAGTKIVLAYDDAPHCAAAIREAGVPVLLTDPGYPGEWAQLRHIRRSGDGERPEKAGAGGPGALGSAG